MNKSTNVLLAAVTGFVAGLLLAPKSGAETREEIKNKAREAKERMEEKAGEATEVLKEGAARAETEARGMAESVKKSARMVTGEASSLSDEAHHRFNRTAGETKQDTKKLSK